ncbi:MAG: hypothetical protein Q4C60_00170 [Eubacteriales bacterium]|nr:hypothetical protein [Eubacteriales bacterium]
MNQRSVTAKKKLSKKLLFAWPTKTVSLGISSVFLGYITYYATDYMGLDPLKVGLVFVLSKIFDGFTDFVTGVLMGISGYDGLLPVQSESANSMIIAINTLVPAALGILLLICFCFYDLDKKMPQIRAELDGKKKQATWENAE